VKSPRRAAGPCGLTAAIDSRREAMELIQKNRI
jgi:hypothetical protein